MPEPYRERLDAISTALARLVLQSAEFDRRLLRIEAALNLSPLATVPEPPAPPLPPPLAEEAPAPLADLEPEHRPAAGIEAQPAPRGLETSIGLTLINRIGALTLVLGIAFFFKWAVDNDWIGPSGRVALGLFAGLAVIAGADLLWRRGQKVFAQGATAVGVCILYLSLYAAFDFYHLIPQSLAFLAMLVAIAMAGALALRYDARAIAALALIGGFLSPVLLSTGEDHPWFLFGYLLLLDLSALAVARARSWIVLEALSFAGTVLLYGAWLSESFKPEKQGVALLFALLFYTLYAAALTRRALFLLAQLLTALTLSYMVKADSLLYFALALPLGAAGLVVAAVRGWRAAVSVSFASFWLCSIFFAKTFSAPPVGALFTGFTCGYLIFLAWTPYWLMVRRERARAQDLAVLALNAAAYFGASYWLLNPGYHAWMGLFAVILAGVNLIAGYQFWRLQPANNRDLTPVLLSLGVALTFLTLAAPIQFTAWRITMAWALEGAALSWIGNRLNNARMLFGSTAVFVLVLFRLLAIDAWIYNLPADYAALFNQRFLTFLIAATCLWFATWCTREPKELRLLYYIAGHFVMLWTLTQEVMAWAARTSAVENRLSVETLSVSLLYALYAVMLVSLGVATRTAVNRIGGLGLIGVVVLKLYLFDVWQLARVYRTLAFVALGVLLLSTSFLYSHFRALIESWWKDDEAQT